MNLMEKEQQEMISNVFDFSKTSVYKAMTPRDEISCISIDDSLEKAYAHIFRIYSFKITSI